MRSSDGPGEPNDVFEEPLDIGRGQPTKASVPSLKSNLHAIGLTCELTDDENLQRFIQQVRDDLPSGGENQAFFIGRRFEENFQQAAPQEAQLFVSMVCDIAPSDTSYITREASGHEGATAFYEYLLDENPQSGEFISQLAGVSVEAPDFAEQFAKSNPSGIQFLAELAQGGISPAGAATWIPGTDRVAGKCAGYLAELVNEERFDKLQSKEVKNRRPECRKGEQGDRRWGLPNYRMEKYEGRYSSAQAVKDQFKKNAVMAHTSVTGGVSKEDLEAFVSSEVLPYTDESEADYDTTKANKGKLRELLLFLVKEPSGQGASGTNTGLGVISIKWHLKVKRYKEKKSEIRHDTTMEFYARSIVYPSVYDLDADPPNRTRVIDQVKDDRNLCP
ncbi:lectin [Streptomyces sp. B27]|uniref:lectin n=1 Tax=Streptomyces TaxID=1883 RepID=UPI000FDB9FF6|nr:lectin [Streptomyces sp. B27]